MLPNDRDIVTQGSSVMLGHPALTYSIWPRISDKHLMNFDGLSYLVLAKFDGHFLLYPTGPVWTVCCQQLRQGQFFSPNG